MTQRFVSAWRRVRESWTGANTVRGSDLRPEEFPTSHRVPFGTGNCTAAFDQIEIQKAHPDVADEELAAVAGDCSADPLTLEELLAEEVQPDILATSIVHTANGAPGQLMTLQNTLSMFLLLFFALCTNTEYILGM